MAMPSKGFEVRFDDRVLMVDTGALLRVQNIGSQFRMDTNQIKQIGYVDPIDFQGEIGSSTTINSNAWGTIDLLAQLTARNRYGNTGGAVPTCNVAVDESGNGGDAANTFTLLTFRDISHRNSDIVIPTREDTVFTRGLWLPNQRLTGLDYTYNVDGLASENYTLEGDEPELFVGTFKDIRVLRCTSTSASVSVSTATVDADSVTGAGKVGGAFLAGAAYQSGGEEVWGDADYVIAYMTINGTKFLNNAIQDVAYDNKAPYAFAIAEDGGTYTITAFVSDGADYATEAAIFAPNARIRAVCVVLPKGGSTYVRTTWDDVLANAHPLADNALDVNQPGLARVERGQVLCDFTNYPQAGATIEEGDYSRALRLQAVAVRADFSGNPLTELGQFNPIYYGESDDNWVTVTMTALEDDMELFARLSGRTVAEWTAFKANDAFAASGQFRERGAIAAMDFLKWFGTPERNRLNNTIRVRLYKEKTQATLLKTITCSNLDLTGLNPLDQAVDGRNQVEFTFGGRGTNALTIVGSGTSPLS